MVREFADMEVDTAADAATHFVDNGELDRRINENCAQLYDLLCLTRGDQYYSGDATATTVTSQALYAWVADFSVTDFYRLIRVTVDDGTRYVDVRPWDYSDYARLKNAESAGVNSLESYRYRLKPTGLELLPQPTGTSHTITCHYVPNFVAMKVDSDTFDGINGWERWAALGAAIDLVNKEEGDPSGLLAQRTQQEALIAKLAASRDEAHPMQIHDNAGDGVHQLNTLGFNDWYD